MVIRWPKAFRPADVQPGTLDERLISFVDLAPTILDLAGAPVPDYMHGQNLLSDDKRTYVYGARDRIDEVNDRQRAVRDERFKYIRSWYPDQPGGHKLAFRDNLEMMKAMWALKEEGKLNEAQLTWFESPGEERLFDLEADPFELHDISTDSAFATDLSRLRIAMDEWLESVDDWSDTPENEMVTGFLDEGEQRKTPAPTIASAGNQVTLSHTDSGASLGYKINEGPWQLYTVPLSVTNDAVVHAKAVRYGWEESEVISSAKEE